MYINKVFLYGNLGRDPELRVLPSGSKVTTFPIATTRVYKDAQGQKQSQTDWHNIVIFGNQAEIAAQYLSKGRPVFIEGRIQTRSWEDQNGQKQYRTEIVAERFQFGPQGGSANSSQSQEIQGQGAEDPFEEPQIPAEEPEEEINPDDIPF